ncbi:24460_t:CDS:2 [Gigaspora margarita]|uniref:24460_t:CDS:1 n=1 Tax=Gigaspora margarita TaxID=4874 RepID=A0ABN7UM88_GIGMA|nr:24460_t:CDS:2 [Gigaspora margarita]
MSNNSSSYESDLENSIILNVNLDALKKSVSNVFQVQCTSIQEFNEGGFHKVYILKMEDGKEYIGRLAISVYLQWKTESEVAVIEYIRLNTHIPVPKIYYWNSSVNNSVGTEYILMKYLPGIHFCEIWSNLSIKKKKLFLLKIIDIQLALKKLTFLKIGSIFFDAKNDQFEIGQDDGNDTFVLTHIDFHTSNILVKNDEIIGVIDWECSDEISHRDPDFIRTMDNIDEEKKNFIPQCLAKKYGK